MSLKLALISDIHHGPDSPTIQGTAALDLLTRALESLEQQKPDILLDLGDRLTDVDEESDQRRLAEVTQYFSALPFAREHIRGNHDVLAPEFQEGLLGSLSNRSLDVENWHLIFLNSYDGSIGGVLSDATLQWLEADLNSTSKPILVFSHQPLDGEVLKGNPIFELEYAAHAHPQNHLIARDLMEKSGKVKLAINGHCHWNHLVQRKGISYLTVQSLVARSASGVGTGSHACLTLDDHEMRLEVFGLEPFYIQVLW